VHIIKKINNIFWKQRSNVVQNIENVPVDHDSAKLCNVRFKLF